MIIVSCDARAEEVVLKNQGGTYQSFDGWALTDEGGVVFSETQTPGNFAIPNLGQFVAGLEPGESVTLVFGLNPVAGPGRVIIFNRNIWNNTGDVVWLTADFNLEIQRQQTKAHDI